MLITCNFTNKKLHHAHFLVNFVILFWTVYFTEQHLWTEAFLLQTEYLSEKVALSCLVQSLNEHYACKDQQFFQQFSVENTPKSGLP